MSERNTPDIIYSPVETHLEQEQISVVTPPQRTPIIVLGGPGPSKTRCGTVSVESLELLFSMIDSMCFSKFILLSVLFISLFQGPAVITILPASLWALLSLIFQFFYFVSGDKAIISFIQPYLYTKFLSFFTDSVLDTTFMIASVIDFFLDVICFAVAFIILFFIFTEPDGTVVIGWESLYPTAVALICFAGLSIVVRVTIIVLSSIKCCRSVCCPGGVLVQTETNPFFIIRTGNQTEPVNTGRGENESSLVEFQPANDSNHGVVDQFETTTTDVNLMVPSVQQQISSDSLLVLQTHVRTYFAVFTLVAALISFGFVVASVHLTLNANFYLLNSDASQYADCDPIIPEICSLPYPSSFWLKGNSSSQTGYRVNFGEKTLPYTTLGRHISPDFLNSFDGFSVGGLLLWKLNGFSDISQLAGAYDIASSTSVSSTTLVIDQQRSTFHPHFAEIDYLEDVSSDKLSYIVPAQSLEYNTRYVVVIKGLRSSKSNALLPATTLTSKYIDAFLTGVGYSELVASDSRFARFVSSAHSFQPALPLLVSLGVDLEEVQILWDFHTASEGSLLGKLNSLYKPTVTRMRSYISANFDNADSSIFKRTKVTYHSCSDNSDGNSGILAGGLAISAFYQIRVPWYLNSNSRVDSYLVPDLMDELESSNFDAGRVPMSDLGAANLLIQIPCSLVSPSPSHQPLEPIRVLQEFGHGLFEDRSRSASFWFNGASYLGVPIWAMDYRGFSRFDLPLASRMLMYNLNNVGYLESAVYQGFVNKVAAREIIPRVLELERDVLKLSIDAVQGFSSNPIADSAIPQVNYLGVSMGGILGAGYAAFALANVTLPDRNQSRTVFMVPGSPFTFLLGRSDIFALYIRLFDLQLYNRKDIRIAMTLLQLVVDSVESSGWANSGRFDKVNTLAQAALGDSTVTTIAAEILARNINSSLLEPAVAEIYGLDGSPTPLKLPSSLNESTASQDITTLQSFMESSYPGDALLVKEQYSGIPKRPTNVHYCFSVRSQPRKQSVMFLTDGVVSNTCNNKPCIFEDHASCG